MLKHQILTNIIHFQKEQTFNYQPGCNLFIGQNCSGKSSVLETMRRCLSLSQNTSMSSPHDDMNVSAATCLFSISAPKDYLFTSTIRFPKTAEREAVWVKVAHYPTKALFGIDLVKETTSKTLVNKKVAVQGEEIIGRITELLQFEDNPNSENLSKIFEEIEQIIEAEDVNKFVGNDDSKDIIETTCEQMLRDYIDGSTVQTFPVRGIGPCQWSKSEKVENSHKENNYIEAQKRSEIIMWYLQEIKDKKIPPEDKRRIERYFDLITNHSGFAFKLTGKDELVAFNKKHHKRRHDGEQLEPLKMLKVPEGMSEAMISSILLGISTFKTVGLEEPERGMHPQMIERMKDLVLREIEDKAIFISSHHPHFLSPWTIRNLFIFKRTEHNGIAFEVVHGLQLDAEDTDKKTPRIITSELAAPIFFAKRVLFVEGEGDYLFTTTMKHLLLTDDTLVHELITKEDTLKEKFRIFLCSLNILSLNGETSKLRFMKLCDKLSINRYFMLDYDAILDDKKSAKRFLNDFELLRYNPEDVEKNVTLLEKDGILVWQKVDGKKDGAIEDVLIELANKHPRVKQIFKDNNVVLKFDPKTKKNTRYKLFRNKSVTDENIKTVVSTVLEYSALEKKQDQNTEILRIFNFLKKKSEEDLRYSESQ